MVVDGIEASLASASVTTSTMPLDCGELYCSVCDVFFFNQNNKHNHMKGKTHTAKLLGERERVCVIASCLWVE